MLTRRAALAGAAPLLMAAKKPPTKSKGQPEAAADAGGTSFSCPGAPHDNWLVGMRSAPFPYNGTIGDSDIPFIETKANGERGHTAPRFGWYGEAHYSDPSVLFSVPPHVVAASARIILYLHGNLATLRREVCGRQGVPRQLAESRLNAVLVAPQFATNALDSSAGKFWEDGGLARFMSEATAQLHARDYPVPESAKVIIVAYSGGYLPAVFGLDVGRIDRRIEGVVLLDALFGEVDRYARVLPRYLPHMFFVSAYSASSREQNNQLRSRLGARTGEWPDAPGPGTAVFVPRTEISHGDFVQAGSPIKAVLGRLARSQA